MHDLTLISTIAVAFTGAWVAGLLAQRMGLSPIVGYLVAGVLLGPRTPGFVANIEIAQQLAELGVILLMFDVGLHFSVQDLWAVRRIAIPGAVGQSLVATALGVLIFEALGLDAKTGMVIGMAMAVASTVVLMRMLMEAGTLSSPQGHVAVGWLLVEDVFTVVVLVLIPVLGSGGEPGAEPVSGAAFWTGLAIALAKLALLVAIVLVGGARVIPWALVRVAKLRSRELFTLTVVVFSIAVAAGAYFFFGASMALGAFLAGMVVAQSPVSHQAAADALPMRDTFAVLFFVSVGMLFDPFFLFEQPLMILAGLAIILLAKPLTALVIVAALGHSARTALTVAIGLAQIGEFSFVLTQLAREHGLMPDAGQNTIIAGAILSISLNPLLFRKLPALESWLRGRPWLWYLLNVRAEREAGEMNAAASATIDQAPAQRLAVVIGYGPVGRSVDHLLREAGLTTVVVEMNMDTVRELNESGQPAIFGDASREAILKQAGLGRASHLVVTLPHSSQRVAVVATARYINPHLRILVRAHYLAERDNLMQAGATAAVFEEGEAAIALARLVLSDTGATRDVVDRSVRDLRTRLILDNVSNLASQKVRSIMVPWTRVARLWRTDSLAQVRRKVAERRYSRWPVIEPGIGHPIGYLLTKDLITETSLDSDWTRLVRPLGSVQPDDDIESTLQGMQRDGASIRVVQSNGTPLGLITVEDILEQVVGRIEDEYPRESTILLSELFHAGGIVHELMAMECDAAIAELASVIAPERLPEGVNVAELAIAREHQLSTHVGFGIAIPHATVPLLAAPLAVLGRSPRGIVFGESSETVHLLFLLVTPLEQPDLHVDLLGQLATLASHPELRERLLNAPHSDEIFSILTEFDRTIAHPEPKS